MATDTMKLSDEVELNSSFARQIMDEGTRLL
jgi:hypothetical protein